MPMVELGQLMSHFADGVRLMKFRRRKLMRSARLMLFHWALVGTGLGFAARRVSVF